MKLSIRKGFTLIEILIVVIILGILAAIVIPQFTNASIDAKHSSVQSTVQTVRSQVALYSLQHGDTVPAAADLWTAMTGTSQFGGATFGPYMQSISVNPFNQSTVVGAAASGTVNGWALVPAATGTKFYGLGKGGTWIGD